MDHRSWWPRGWRGLALLIVAGIALASLVSPAIANIGTVKHLWNEHIRPKGDARWVRQQGPILLAAPVASWQLNDGSAAGTSLFRTTNVLTFQRSAAGTGYVDLAAAVPTAMYGATVQLVGVELCYDATFGGAYVDTVDLVVWRASDSGFADLELAVTDTTDRTDDTCRSYVLGTPFTLTPDDMVTTTLTMTTSASAGIQIGRATYILQPNGTTALVTPRSPTTILKPVGRDRVPEGATEPEGS